MVILGVRYQPTLQMARNVAMEWLGLGFGFRFAGSHPKGLWLDLLYTIGKGLVHDSYGALKCERASGVKKTEAKFPAVALDN